MPNNQVPSGGGEEGRMGLGELLKRWLSPAKSGESGGAAPGAPDPRATLVDFKPDRPPPRLVAGKYEILRELGRGQMGVVYLARHAHLGRLVAVKTMREDFKMSPRQRSAFVQEAQLVARLKQPNIVDIYDIIEESGDLSIVLEYIEGKTLGAVLEERGALPPAEAVAILRGICAALAYAHEQRVIHRDLKPTNVMLATDGSIRVTDFGIARVAKDTLTRLTGTDTSGTLAYMAPEQHLGRYDAAADIFSAGVLLYECLTGELPFRGPDFLSQKERSTYVPVRELSPNLPDGLEAVVDRCLKPGKADRFAGADEMLEALGAFEAAKRVDIGSVPVPSAASLPEPDHALPSDVVRMAEPQAAAIAKRAFDPRFLFRGAAVAAVSVVVLAGSAFSWLGVQKWRAVSAISECEARLQVMSKDPSYSALGWDIPSAAKKRLNEASRAVAQAQVTSGLRGKIQLYTFAGGRALESVAQLVAVEAAADYQRLRLDAVAEQVDVSGPDQLYSQALAGAYVPGEFSKAAAGFRNAKAALLRIGAPRLAVRGRARAEEAIRKAEALDAAKVAGAPLAAAKEAFDRGNGLVTNAPVKAVAKFEQSLQLARVAYARAWEIKEAHRLAQEEMAAAGAAIAEARAVQGNVGPAEEKLTKAKGLFGSRDDLGARREAAEARKLANDQEKLGRLRIAARLAVDEGRQAIESAKGSYATDTDVNEAKGLLASAQSALAAGQWEKALLLAGKCKTEGDRVRSSVCQTCRRTGTCQKCNGSGKVTCGTCSGGGTVPHEYYEDETVTCSACGGSGFLTKSSAEAGMDVRCPTCGSNRFHVGCTSCGGNGMSCASCGFVYRGAPWNPIPDYQAGSGRTTGRVRKTRQDTCSSCGGRGKVDCPSCGGNGKCSQCRGRGII